MNIPPGIFKSYDIRGTYPKDINEENIRGIGSAIYVFFKEKLQKDSFTVVLGRDMRLSSPALYESLKQTLLAAGAQIIDIGIVSTPTFYFAVSHYNYDSGIQITASHNPKDDNGLKFLINTGKGLLKIGKPTGMEDVKKLALDGIIPPSTDTGTIIEKPNVVDDEVINGLAFLENPTIKKFTIVADPANAMGASYLEAIEKKVPMNLIKMNFNLDGSFPVHQPDPMQPKNLVAAQQKVKEVEADLALVPDGDGDRLFIIDEKGNVVPPSLIIGILAKELLTKHPGSKVVVDLKYILTPKKIVEDEYKGQLLISKTGHAFITELMTNEDALFAGEASAHYYYKATGNAENQVITILSILKILTEEGKPLSVVAEEFRRSFESGEINFEVENAKEIIAAVKEQYKDGNISELDGVAVNYPEWRFNLRTSNTEPLLRFNLEALKKDLMETKKEEIIAFIKNKAVLVANPSHH